MMKRILRLVCGAIIVLVLVNLITEFSVNDTLIGVVKDNVIYKEQDLETYFNLSTTNEEKQTYTNTYINWKNYKIVLMESVIDKNKHKGYLKFSVSKENTNMREIFINTQPSNQQTFGEEKGEIERVKEVFAEHLRQSPDFELLWSDTSTQKLLNVELISLIKV